MKKNQRKVFIYIYAALVLALLVSCKQVIFTGDDKPLPTTPPIVTNPGVSENQDSSTDQTEPDGTSQPTATATPVPEASVPDGSDPEKEPSSAPTPTATPTPSPSPVPSVTETPGAELISVSEAKAVLLTATGPGYEAEQTGEVTANGDLYYLFDVSDAEYTYTPQVAVNTKTKELFYFYSHDEMVEFANFPPDKVENAGDKTENTNDGFTADDAVALLRGLTAEDLGLPVVLEEYTIMVDEWTTMVYGMECYCVNAYAELIGRKQLMGVFYVSIDGEAAYRSDMGDFVLIY